MRCDRCGLEVPRHVRAGHRLDAWTDGSRVYGLVGDDGQVVAVERVRGETRVELRCAACARAPLARWV